MNKLNLTVLCLVAAGTMGQVRAERLVALTNLVSGGQALRSFDSSSPDIFSEMSITGVPANEELQAIDYRPLTGQLYALSDMDAIYTISVAGVATKVGGGFMNPDNGNQLNGGNFGFDFNPQIDKIRIVSDANQNFVAHPDTGDANIAMTTPVAFAAGDANEGVDPNVVHHAYDGNVLGALASSTQLRAIDTQLDILVTQANNAGTLQTVGSLGIDASDIGGFDVATSGRAFAAFSDGVGAVTSTLYSIDLSTGAATSLGTISTTVWGLAAVPVPEPSSAALVVLAALGGLWGIRRR